MQKCSHGESPMQGLGQNKPSHHWPWASTYAVMLTAKERVVFLRLRLVLVKASKILSARTHISQLEHIVQRAYDTRHRLTLPDQRTEELMIWGYAIDKQHRVMAWLGPACSSQEPFAPLIRHWRSGAIMHTVPLPGIHFFDAWRIRPQLTPSLGTNELIPEEPANVDYGQSEGFFCLTGVAF